MAGMLHIRRLSHLLLTPIVIILVLALGIGLFFIGIPGYRGASAADDMLYKGPSATINGVKIKDKDFNDIYLQLLQKYGSYMPEAQLKEEALKYVINHELIKQAIKDRKIEVSGTEIDFYLAKVKKANPTEEQMESVFKQVGVSNMRGLKKVLEEQLQRQNLFAQLAEEEKIEAAEEELKERYELIDIAHILIATSDRVVENPPSDSEALKEAQTVYEKLQNGGDFAELAKEYSDDQSNKDNSGQLGRNTVAYYKSQMVKEFIDAAMELKVGEVSNPVKTPYGYHIIKVLDKKLAEGEEWETEKALLRKEVLSEKYMDSDKINTWIKDQLDQAEVVILDPALRAYRLRIDKKFAEAAQAYEKALTDKRYKNNLDLYISTALTYNEAEKFTEALDVLERIPEKITDELPILFAKARIYHTQGDQEKTKKTLATAVEKSGDNVNDLKQIQYLMTEFKYEKEAKNVETKIKQIEEQRAQQQKELEKLLQEEQEKVEDAQGDDAETTEAN